MSRPFPHFKVMTFPAVTLVTIATMESGSVKLGWKPSEEAAATGYLLKWGTESKIYTAELDVGPVTEATITGLEKGRVYYFVVATYFNPKKEPLALSEEIQYKIPLDLGL